MTVSQKSRVNGVSQASLKPADVPKKIAKIVFQSIQPVAEFYQIESSIKALNLRYVTMIPIQDFGESNLSDSFGFADLLEVIDHCDVVGIVDALHGTHHPADLIFL